MNETNTVNPIDKLKNLTIDENNNVVSVADRTVFGLFSSDMDEWIFYNPIVGTKTTYRNNNVTSIELFEGKATIYLRGKRPTACPQFFPRDYVEPMPGKDDLENVEEKTPTVYDKSSMILDEIDSKLIGLKVRIGGVDPTPIYDDDEQNTYGYFTENYDKITFSDGKVYNAYKCAFSEIKTIELQLNDSILVTFNDGKTKTFLKYIESDTAFNPKPEFENSYTGLEEIIRYLLGNEQLKECLYTSDINRQIMIDWKLFGESDGLKEYQAAGEITQLIQFIESAYAEVERNQLKRPNVSRDKVKDIMEKLARKNVINPFLKEIQAVQPDDRYKIERFLSEVGLNSRLTNYEKNKEYIEKVSCALFLAIIERQFVNDDRRSIRFVLVLIGGQRPGKSLVCKNLGLFKYYHEARNPIDNEQKYMEGLNGGCIIAEMAEGTQFTPNKEKAYKEWFDKNSTTYRVPYDRQPSKFQKRFIEIITTNDHQILTDITGNSRYYPVFLDPEFADIPIQEYNEEMMKKYYADALKRYNAGERWYDYVDNDEFQCLADVVRGFATRDVQYLPEVIDYVLKNCREIGSRIRNEDIRNYLRDSLYCDEKTVEKLLRLWGKISGNYGFKKIATSEKVGINLDGSENREPYRGYERFKESMINDIE